MEQKKRSVGASERDEWLGVAWRVMIAGSIDAGRFVFVDECGAHTSLTPLYGWSLEGEQAYFKVPRNWGVNITLLASMSAEGMGPCLAVEGATATVVFEAYLERLLAPALRPGPVVVMDNLGAHRPKRVRQLIEERGCELIYLLPYSPDLNPIEEAFATLKHILRKIGARGKQALIEVMGRALRAVSAQDVRGFFAHYGYRTPAQQLKRRCENRSGPFSYPNKPPVA